MPIAYFCYIGKPFHKYLIILSTLVAVSFDQIIPMENPDIPIDAHPTEPWYVKLSSLFVWGDKLHVLMVIIETKIFLHF